MKMKRSIPVWLSLLAVVLAGCGRKDPNSFPMVIVEECVYNAYQVKNTWVIRYYKPDVDRIIQSEPTNPLALFAAAGRGDPVLTKQLLDRGADPNKRTDFGHYAIHEAANGHKEVVDLLVAAGADVNVRVSPKGPASPNQWTPLHYAAYKGHKEIAEVLLANGANLSARDLWGKTPVDYAREQKKTKMIELLLPGVYQGSTRGSA
ncbi:MAG: ankyrin repeat domain-containing protein [Planctomycetes bacterium]|nr:ankyrin repeat domain-containing protein [Planctomycetota bacterium]